jgi:predicted PurR-regulated permease PerM
VVALHLVSANLLIPKFIGSRVNIGPVAATVGMLFWNWIWGAVGVYWQFPSRRS